MPQSKEENYFSENLNMMTIAEKQKKLEVIGKYDVVVAGGGPAGIAAAVASARTGARTLLIERYGYLGGMMTGSYVTMVLGMGDGKRPIIRGIAQEIYKELDALKMNAVRLLDESGDYDTDVEVFKWFSIKILEEAGVQILLHSLVCAVIEDGGLVQGIITESKSGRKAILAKIVVDATADGDVAHFAGSPYELSRYDVTLVNFLIGVDREKVANFKNSNPKKFEKFILKAKNIGGGKLPGEYRYLKNYDVTDVHHLTEAEIEARKALMKSLFFLKKNVPGYEEAKIHLTAPQLGVRESRRIRGEYVLTEDDLRNNRKFPDTICRCGTHMIGYETYGTKGLEYDIPYRCLVPLKIEGLLCAGRCISVTHEVLNTMRLIAPCFATGQAAGVAAAIAVKNKTQPRKTSIGKIQKVLKNQGVYLG